jgi:hypothetical protein
MPEKHRQPIPTPPQGRRSEHRHDQRPSRNPLDPTLDMAPIGLEELNTQAEFLTRTDRKYVMSGEQFLALADSLRGLRVLDIGGRRTFGYRSLYFDTPEWDSYSGAARRRPDRFKVRLREYRNTGEQFLEIKLRTRGGQTHKLRTQRPSWMSPLGCGSPALQQSDLAVLEEIPRVAPLSRRLLPALWTDYLRTTFVLDAAFRMTVDTAVSMHLPGGGEPDGEDHRSTGLGDLFLVETKGPGRPTAADRQLWRNGVRPVQISKYATGLAMLHPNLPANKWHRLIDRLRQGTLPTPAHG